MQARERAVAAFTSAHRRPPTFVARAPGRVNLIGEHTDYNDGFVLPMALPMDTVIAGEPHPDGRIEVTSTGFGRAEFSITDDPGSTVVWARYILGMASLLLGEGYPVSGWVGHVETDIPAGASLSSSAALEVAAGLACTHAADSRIGPEALARVGQRVENEVLGLPSGIMDQLASAASLAGTASLIDCRDLTIRAIPLPPETTVVVMDTGTRRELVESAYAERRATCARVARAVGVKSLRSASMSDLNRLETGDHIGLRRARHVISENERTVAAAHAMERGDAVTVGALMHDSHASLRDDYEVSGPALDHVVGVAEAITGCLGARMTGGGFAGAAVALVTTRYAESFRRELLTTYVAPPAQPATAPPAAYLARPSAGASVE